MIHLTSFIIFWQTLFQSSLSLFSDSSIFTVRSSGPNVQGEMIYSTVGNSPAPTYFKIGNDGVVKVATNLTLDRTNDYEVQLLLC